MKCPQCNEDFLLTWKRYFKASFARMTCPFCRTQLIVTHRWFYWPFVVLGVCFMGVPMALLGAEIYGLTGLTIGGLIGALSVGFPVDRFIEGKFSVLKVRKARESSNSL